MNKYGFFFKQVKYDFIIFFREPLFALPILLVPAIFFMIFTSIYAQYGINEFANTYIPLYVILISFMTIFFNIGLQSVNDRESGVYKRVIISPTNIFFITATYIVRGVVISFLGLAEMLLIAKVVFEMPITNHLGMFSLSFFIMIAILLVVSLSIHGLFKNSKQVTPMTILGFQYVLFASGMMFPIESLPKFLRLFVYINPVYHMNQISIAVWNGAPIKFIGIVALFVTTVLCGGLLKLQSKREL